MLSVYMGDLLNQCSPVPRARSSTAGKDARAQIYAGLGNGRLTLATLHVISSNTTTVKVITEGVRNRPKFIT